MLKFIRDSFREFCGKYPALAVLGIVLLILVSSQWYYRWCLSNPNMRHIVISAEKGYGVDSAIYLRNEMYHNMQNNSQDIKYNNQQRKE